MVIPLDIKHLAELRELCAVLKTLARETHSVLGVRRLVAAVYFQVRSIFRLDGSETMIIQNSGPQGKGMR